MLGINNAIDLIKKYGENVYSEILMQFIKISIDTLRKDDIAGHISQDTIAFMLPETALDNVDIVIERLFAAYEQHKFYSSKKELVEVTFSAVYAKIDESSFIGGLIDKCVGRISVLKSNNEFQKEMVI